MFYPAVLSLGLHLHACFLGATDGAMPPGVKAMGHASRGKNHFLLVRRDFLLGEESSPQVLLATCHYVELAHMGMFAARILGN